MNKGGVYAIGLFIVALTTMIGILCLPWEQFGPGMYEASVQPVNPEDHKSIRHMVATGEQVWMQSSGGELWMIRRTARDAVRVATPDVVVDLCAQNGGPVIVTARPGSAPIWTFRRWSGRDWSVVARVASDGEGLAGVACESQTLILLSSRRLITIRGVQRTEIPLSQRVPRDEHGTLLATPNKIYLGIDVGEFGGGLMSIDRRNGETISIESNVSGALCGGPLNRECDDVHGVIVDPWKPDCVAVAIGIGFNTHGRLVEVCDGRVKRLYFSACKGESDSPGHPPNPEPSCTEPFFGLVRSGDKLLTVGLDGLYLIDGRGRAERQPLPSLTRYGSFAANFDKPGYIVVKPYADDPEFAFFPPELVER